MIRAFKKIINVCIGETAPWLEHFTGLQLVFHGTWINSQHPQGSAEPAVIIVSKDAEPSVGTRHAHGTWTTPIHAHKIIFKGKN